MAQIPPPDPTGAKFGPDQFTAWVNGWQKGLRDGTINLDTMAAFLHKAMVEALVAEGLDVSSRLGSGSASKAAGSVSSKLRRASQNINAAIILIKGAKAAAEKNVDAPIQAARAARARAKSSYTV